MSAIAISQPIGGLDKAAVKGVLVEEQRIQELLRKAGIPFTGVRTLAGDIAEFQKLVGVKEDGRLDKGGLTLRYLNAVTNPPRLTVKDTMEFGGGLGKSTMSTKRALQGGYQICYTTDDGAKGDTRIPKPYRVLLGVDAANVIDVTDRPMKDVMDAAKLGDLLTMIDRRGAWGTSLSLMLFVTLRGQTITPSGSMNLRCPVRPHSGKMLSTKENEDLLYLGKLAPKGSKTEKDEFYGRFFKKVPNFDKYVFSWGGYLELCAEKRGFDCITYAGTTCEAPSTAMGAKGEQLAQALGATDVVHDKATLNSAKMSALKSFFEKNTGGYYLLYSGGHVTLVVDGFVYEFKPNQSQNRGFVKARTADWVASHTDGWTLKRLVTKPPLASE